MDTVRNFHTGATRDTEDGKLDFEGFLSPIVLEDYAKYLNTHRVQSDGKIRDSDNWQKGIPVAVYMKSLLRHVVDLWKLHRGIAVKDRKTGLAVTFHDAIGGILFNAMGYRFEQLKGLHIPQAMIANDASSMIEVKLKPGETIREALERDDPHWPR